MSTRTAGGQAQIRNRHRSETKSKWFFLELNWPSSLTRTNTYLNR